MTQSKFQRLGESDDYSLDDLSQEPLRYAHNNNEPAKPSRTPSRWQSIRSAYQPSVTYVAAPADQDNHSQKLRRAGTDPRASSRLSQLISNPVSELRIPTFAAPWQHEKLDSHQQSKPSTVRYFDRGKQRKRTFVNGFLQWLITLAIAAGQFATLWAFSRPDIISKYEKYSFNAIITLLSLALGLTVVAALRAYAKLLSWRFLASKYRSLQDFELVMNCDSQTKVLKLLWAGRSPGRFWLNKTQLLCIASLFVFIGLQIAIGLLGLTYSIDPSDEVDHVRGNVSLVDLTNIYQDESYNASSFADQTAAANYYGLVGQNYYQYWDIPLGQGSEGFESVYTADNLTYFYNFVEMDNATVNSNNPTYDTSKRWIQSDTSCVKLDIISGGYVPQEDSWSWLNYTDEHGHNQYISVFGQTTWTTTFISNSSNSTCGERCTNILILDTAGYENDNASDTEYPYGPQLFACNSTTSKVYNTNTCPDPSSCTLSDKLAKIAAGAIGWSGTWYNDGNPLQYQNYPPGSPYSWDACGDLSAGCLYPDASWRASQVSWFTAGALAAMDDAGPRIVAEGMAPKPGVVLVVKWKYAIPVLCVVPGVQFVILLIVCVWSTGAMIKDGSYLSAARLLRPVVERLGEHGCALTGDELARTLGNFKVIYGVRAPPGTSNSTAYTPNEGSGVDWHVGIISESEGYGHEAEEGWSFVTSFPPGRYDGAGNAERRPVQKKRRKWVLVEEDSDVECEFLTNEKAHLLRE